MLRNRDYAIDVDRILKLCEIDGDPSKLNSFKYEFYMKLMDRFIDEEEELYGDIQEEDEEDILLNKEKYLTDVFEILKNTFIKSKILVKK